MISVVELKKALVDVIRSKYGKSYKYYGIEVTEGYEKPSFFTQIVPVEMENVTTNFADSAYSFVVTYFQKKSMKRMPFKRYLNFEKLLD